MSFKIPALDVPLGAIIIVGGREETVKGKLLHLDGSTVLNLWPFGSQELVEVVAFADPRDELIARQREQLEAGYNACRTLLQEFYSQFEHALATLASNPPTCAPAVPVESGTPCYNGAELVGYIVGSNFTAKDPTKPMCFELAYEPIPGTLEGNVESCNDPENPRMVQPEGTEARKARLTKDLKNKSRDELIDIIYLFHERIADYEQRITEKPAAQHGDCGRWNICFVSAPGYKKEAQIFKGPYLMAIAKNEKTAKEIVDGMSELADIKEAAAQQDVNPCSK